MSTIEKNDMKLWIEFLEQSFQKGISLNLISYTEADCTIYTDTSSHGLGGYNKDSGLAWRYKLPDWMIRSFHINTLEFIAATVGIWIGIIHAKTEFLKIKCLTDNSSAI